MSDLGDRMKGYESVPRSRLVPKLPVLIRLDGKAFHTLTRGCEKPWDQRFQEAMWETAKALCAEISGCRVAYAQSDEITLLLVDYQTNQTQGWFDYDLQKIVSVSAGIASATFCSWWKEGRGVFDSRAWNLPPHEVTNCFIWRQQDATRNSLSSLAQAHFSAKQLHGKRGPDMHDMLMAKGINWNDCPIPQKRGACIVRETFDVAPKDNGVPILRHRWIVDEEIPVFTEDREYIEKFVRA